MGQVLFLLLAFSLSAALVTVSWRADRVLGRLVLSGLVVYLAGSFAMGTYLREVRGRDYLAPDEPAYQKEGALIVHGWRNEDPHVPVIAGGWPYVNAAVISMWGPSQTSLRIVNALAGAASIAAAYWLAVLLFHSRGVARAASGMVLLSPSLFIWALTNLKERTLGLLVLVTLAAAVALVQRWTLQRWLLLLGAVFLLGELRHYYAAMIGWLSIVAFTLFSSLPVRRRNLPAVALLLSIGFVLQAVSGTFLATSMSEETVVRYVPLEPEAGLPSSGSSSGSSSGYSPLGATSGRGETTSRTLSGLLRSLWFVLVGRFESRTGAGRVFAAITWPEWLLNFALLPIVTWVSLSALRRRDIPVALVAAFVAGMVLLLAWTHGDDWSTFRFRAVYWPAYLTLAAPGMVHLYTVWESRRSAAVVQRLTP